MKKTSRPVVPEAVPDSTDSELFKRSVGPVRPVHHDRIDPQVKRPPARAKFRERDDQAVLKDSLSDHFDPGDYTTGEELGFARPGLQHRTLKRLRRGQHTLQAECDLHGQTVIEARQTLSAFLQRCQTHQLSCVRIIHGKGYGSQQHIPILKSKVGAWLRQCDDVLAFCSARPADGGTGAIYVLLKKN